MKKLRFRLSKKLFRKYLTVYTRLFLILALLVLGSSLFIIQRNTHHDVVTNMTAVLDTLVSFQTSMQQKATYLSSDSVLLKALNADEKLSEAEAAAQIRLDLRSIVNADSSLYFIMLDFPDGSCYFPSGGYQDALTSFIKAQPEYAAVRTREASLISPFYSRDALLEFLETGSGTFEVYWPETFCLYYTRVMLSGQSVLMTCLFDVSQTVSSCIAEASSTDGFFLFNSHSDCIYSYDPQQKSAGVPESFSLLSPSAGMMCRDGYYYLANQYSSVYAVGFVSLWELIGRVAILLLILILLYLFPLVIALLYLFPVNERMLLPLYRLNDSIHTFSIGEKEPELIKTEDEIEDLSLSFRRMALNINAQASELSQKEREKALTYYKLMTTQLDPHFIYNTMNIINILARQNDCDGIVKVNTALTRVLRERLNTQNTTFSPVEEEIRTLKQYLVIMDYRYHQQVNVDFEIEEETEGMLIPKNILQPLVENSYYHGLVKENGQISGNIGIFIYMAEEEIIIEVSDDGAGFQNEHLEYLKSHSFSSGKDAKKDTHIGIENIYQRLTYLYGDRFDMDIQSNPSQGATIVLTLPCIKEASSYQSESI